MQKTYVGLRRLSQFLVGTIPALLLMPGSAAPTTANAQVGFIDLILDVATLLECVVIIPGNLICFGGF
jgi:hypothetical protein